MSQTIVLLKERFHNQVQIASGWDSRILTHLLIYKIGHLKVNKAIGNHGILSHYRECNFHQTFIHIECNLDHPYQERNLTNKKCISFGHMFRKKDQTSNSLNLHKVEYLQLF